MNEVTRVLSAIEQGDPQAAEQLLPLVYDELRRLAAQRLAQEKPGQTLQATALVHEAYLRLVDSERGQDWNSRGHFFAAAAEAMRRILVENARRKRAVKHGGARRSWSSTSSRSRHRTFPTISLAVDEALTHFTVGRSESGRAGETPLLRRAHRQASGRGSRYLATNGRLALGVCPGLALPTIQGEGSASTPGDKDFFANP